MGHSDIINTNFRVFMLTKTCENEKIQGKYLQNISLDICYRWLGVCVVQM